MDVTKQNQLTGWKGGARRREKSKRTPKLWA